MGEYPYSDVTNNHCAEHCPNGINTFMRMIDAAYTVHDMAHWCDKDGAQSCQEVSMVGGCVGGDEQQQARIIYSHQKCV